MMTEKSTLIRDLLSHFTGTVEYHKHQFGFGVYTDGVLFMAEECEAFWLIDLVMSYRRKESFQIWTLKVNPDKTAVATMIEDTGQPELVSQEIPYTDFPLDEIKFYFIDGVLLLPSEY